MQTLLLRAFVLVFLAMGIATACSWNTGIQLHLQPTDREALQRDLEKARAERAALAAANQTVPVIENSEASPGTDLATGDPVGPKPETPEEKPAEASPYVTTEEAHELFEFQFVGPSQVIFLDARARNEFEKGHIPGAMSLPAGDFGAAVPRKARDYLPGNIVVIYCQGADCHDSHDVAKRLQQANMQVAQILIFKDGYPAWVAAGHPTNTGPDNLWQ